MEFQKSLIYVLLGFGQYLTLAQRTPEFDAIYSVSDSVNSFGTNLLWRTALLADDSLNLAISPYTIWTLMTIISEGAKGDTANQLEKALRIPALNDRQQFRTSFRSLSKYLLENPDGVRLDITNTLFTTADQSLNRNFESLAKSFYGAGVMPIDFRNLIQAQQLINSHIAAATQNRIKSFVSIDDLIGAQILITSALFFKGQWSSPFNRSDTKQDTFYNDNGDDAGQVMMMYQNGTFPFASLPNMTGQIIELPYGSGKQMSMIAILPRKRTPLTNLLRRLASMPFSDILDLLTQSEQNFEEGLAEVYLPRFTINSDLNLNQVLDMMGIQDVFNAEKADLLGMFPHYLYLSRVIQRAKIEVNEEGTVATAVAGGIALNRNYVPKFLANRPFVYFIVHKQTRSIIFAGKVSNPNVLCDVCAGKL